MIRIDAGGGLLDKDHRRICIVLLTGIGDVVHGLPVANALKDADPEREIVWVAEPAPSEVLREHPSVDRIVVFRKRDGLKGVLDLFEAFRPLPCDLTLNMQRYFKSVFPTLFSGARTRVGLPPSKTRDGITHIHSHHLPEGPWRHVQDLFLDFLPSLGLSRPEEPQWRITLSEAETEARKRFFEPFSDRLVAGVVLASANPKKDWPVERYIPLVETLEEDFGYTVLLLGGPSEAERRAAQAVVDGTGAHPIPAMTDSVRTLMWRISGCSLLVSPDTGPLHIAHAMEIPVVGLFGHTNPWRVGPYSRFRDLVVDAYTEPGEPPDPAGYLPKLGRMERITLPEVMERVELARIRYGA